MDDLHSINDAINRRAGRKLGPSILVSLSLVALIWVSLSVQPIIFAGVVTLAVILGIREISRAFAATKTNISTNALTAAAIGLSAATWVDGVEGLAVATAVALPVLLINLLRSGPEGFVRSATALTLALIYLPFLAGFIILLGHNEKGLEQVMTFVILVGCNDTFGYFVGVLIGKHPMAPNISPKKSWEGLAGSIVFTMFGGALMFHYVLSIHWYFGSIVGLLIVFTATSGDLIESAMKRDLHLKDMGSLLPGHGGVLDRLDSVLLSAPALWMALELVHRYL
jgi:phosphatidate cytidylyltransferase